MQITRGELWKEENGFWHKIAWMAAKVLDYQHISDELVYPFVCGNLVEPSYMRAAKGLVNVIPTIATVSHIDVLYKKKSI